MKVALYVRVSTADQNTDLQIRELTEYAERQGWTIVATYQDVISGAKASRPGLDELKCQGRSKFRPRRRSKNGPVGRRKSGFVGME